jgi:hypothetical protein
MDPQLIADSYERCGWQYQTVPKVWIDSLVQWMVEDKIIPKPVSYDEVTNFTFQQGYPGYPGWEKMKK